MSGAILALTSLDFLGLGVPSPTPLAGRAARAGQGESRRVVDLACRPSACWSRRCCLLTFMGDALRNALDTRISDAMRTGGREDGRRTSGQQRGCGDIEQCALLELKESPSCASARRSPSTTSTPHDSPTGERVALVGESGSGKSVTALSILRLLRDAAGEAARSVSTARGTAHRRASARCAACAARTSR